MDYSPAFVTTPSVFKTCTPASLTQSAYTSSTFSGSSLFYVAPAKRPDVVVVTPPVKKVQAVAAPSKPIQSTTTAGSDAQNKVVRDDIRNIAIIAHVDHGKTTLVDAMLSEAKVFRENETVQERIMDSNDLERERGITILAKNTALNYKGTKINIVDTPGHADFGGEVERVLNMVDGCLLVVDAVDGPKPQTRFVLRKALALGIKVLVVVNKIDRPQSRPEYVIDNTFDLFVELGATDEQADFPICYTSAIQKVSGYEPDDLKPNFEALFEQILALPPPKVDIDAPLQMLISNVDYDEFKGRLGIARIEAGTVTKGSQVAIVHPNKPVKRAKLSELFAFNNLGRVEIESARAGDIVMFAGINDFEIGDTISCPEKQAHLTPLEVEEPTVRMTFSVNTSEFAGREGKFVTSRNIRDRLYKELERNVALKVLPTDSPETYEVCGRGALHLTVLIETMRREGYELMIGPPSVILKTDENGQKLEPFENVEVEVKEEYIGAVVDMLGRRKGEMVSMGSCSLDGVCSVSYIVPTRGLLGIKNAMLTATRGTAVMSTLFHGYKPYTGDLQEKENGSLIAHESGKVTTYGIEGAQDRGKLMVKPGEDIYANQVIGIHQRRGDLKVNVCKQKQLTNFRAATKEIATGIQGLLELSLDDCIEYIGIDEVVEVTPKNVRIKKVVQDKRK